MALTINVTREYAEKRGAVFFNEKLPELLPKPNMHSGEFIGPPSCNYNDFLFLQERNSEYSGKAYRLHKKAICYQWYNFNTHAYISLASPTKVVINGPVNKTNDKKRYTQLDENTQAAENAASNYEGNKPPGSDIRGVLCKGLKPINSIDDLLYQIYINFDNDCLSEKTVEKMEEIWGIKILSYKKMKEEPPYKAYAQSFKSFCLHQGGDPAYFFKVMPKAFCRPLYGLNCKIISFYSNSSDFYGKSYASERDAFVLEWDNDNPHQKYLRLRIGIADEYNEKHGTLFPGGNFPKMLPYPSIEAAMASNPPNLLSQSRALGEMAPENNSEFLFDYFTYRWFNSDKTWVMYLEGDRHGKVISIRIGPWYGK